MSSGLKSARYLAASLTRPLPLKGRRHDAQALLAIPCRRTTCSSSAAAASVAEEVRHAEASYKIVDRAADFAEKQARRPDFDHAGTPIEVTKQPNPGWQYGDGARDYDPSWTHTEHRLGRRPHQEPGAL
ncbi:hypothetical protein LMH87_005972 [Akanthomyces muscarius]|uniref:Uncharacterized protein n=1 Tax=Akanthomyces muscarius TaxID=2231603 RepID=A0A9W8QMZ5_AKAMU|nr:hypothetical protein LMH87_005972 [Akanthomyces muscarius]KAJ4164295.1 hypothetical protein LMH87_005972 [Akanthomyces muscarius]